MLIGKLHVDKPLTNFAISYKPDGLIGDLILPMINTDKQHDIYDVWDQADFFRNEHDKRAPGEVPSNVRFRVGSDNFYCENYELGYQVIAEDQKNADASKRAFYERGSVAGLIDKIKLGQEVRLAELLYTATNIGSNSAVSSVWTGIGADPVGDINTAIDNVHYATGFRPNNIIVNNKVWNAIQRHTSIIDKSVNPNVTGGGRGYPTTKDVAELFNVNNIFIGNAFKNTTQEGLEKSIIPIWSNHCLVYYDPPGELTTRPRLAAKFNWKGAPTGRMQVIRHKPDTLRKSQTVTVGMYQDEKITAAPLGFLLTGATTN